MVFYPSISVQPLPAIQVTTNVQGLSYNAIVESLGPVVYAVQVLYYQASGISQFNNPIQYIDYDANGNLQRFVVPTVIDANQFYPSMWVSLAGRNFIFDGQNFIDFDLLAGQSIQFIMYGERTQVRDMLDELGLPNNFKLLAKELNNPDFFNEYADLL
jgi:hypothetical protein